MKDIEKKLTSVLESLQDKEESIISSGGSITAYIDGLGNLKKVVLNKDLDEFSKESLEKEILDVFELIKVQASYNVMNAMSEESKEEEEKYNVS